MMKNGGNRQIRSEPPTYASIQEDSGGEASDTSSVEADSAPRAKFVASRHDSEPGVARPIVNREDQFSRTKSAVSLPVSTISSISSDGEQSLYDRTMHMLATDAMYQKEIALGKRIGFYRLGKELGCGNFSKVKLGIHVLTKEKVAVKIMEKTKMDQKAQRLLAREMQSMERMHHPNIIRLFECVETLTRVHLVLEYAGGGELYVYVHERGKLPEGEAKPLFAQVVAAISHMHSRNLVHRDVKPENIMFAAPGIVKLVDFGFSCMVPSAAEQLTTFCGSPPYAAPELFRDKSYNGAAVDVWALGVLLYFMLVGVTPFRGENVSELRQIISQGIVNIPDYLSITATNLIKNMLAMEPENRSKVEEIKKNYWLQDCRFEKSYLNITMNTEKDETEKSKIVDRIARQMHSYGITDDMMEEASEKGPRNSVTGTYRIVQFQVEAEGRNKPVTASLASEFGVPAGSKKIDRRSLKHRSKTCSIL